MVAVAGRSVPTLTETSPDAGVAGGPVRASGPTARAFDITTQARQAAYGRVVSRRVPLWRRIIGLAVLVAIWLGIGLAIAAILGGAAAGAALLLQEVLT